MTGQHVVCQHSSPRVHSGRRSHSCTCTAMDTHLVTMLDDKALAFLPKMSASKETLKYCRGGIESDGASSTTPCAFSQILETLPSLRRRVESEFSCGSRCVRSSLSFDERKPNCRICGGCFQHHRADIFFVKHLLHFLICSVVEVEIE